MFDVEILENLLLHPLRQYNIWFQLQVFLIFWFCDKGTSLLSLAWLIESLGTKSPLRTTRFKLPIDFNHYFSVSSSKNACTNSNNIQVVQCWSMSCCLFFTTWSTCILEASNSIDASYNIWCTFTPNFTFQSLEIGAFLITHDVSTILDFETFIAKSPLKWELYFTCIDFTPFNSFLCNFSFSICLKNLDRWLILVSSTNAA